MAKEPIKQGPVEDGIEAGEKPDHVVDAGKDLIFKRAFKVLEGGAKTKEMKGKLDKADLKVAGQKLDNPIESYSRLQEALKLVRTYFGKNLRIDLNDLTFRKFHGDMVGESTKEGTYVDPIMLMHPAVRLAHVIAHELAHKNKKIINEGLVEGYVDRFFGHEDGAYEAAVEKFKEFAKKCDKKGDARASVGRLYELYYHGDFEKIYGTYEKNYMSELKTQAEKDEAFRLFQEVFPELHYTADEKKAGYFDLKRPAVAKKAA
ncbi:hypothetical protein HZA40_04635 [Candidatus Peregrinibacteria bacterium]|nr:hypothetical protein [Candidatus Peregrinibacteria bacterium]